jgi:hypothetical protein
MWRDWGKHNGTVAHFVIAVCAASFCTEITVHVHEGKCLTFVKIAVSAELGPLFTVRQGQVTRSNR